MTAGSAPALQVLAVDTSTEACSAALLLANGETRLRFELTERGHAELILPMIDSLLVEAGLRLADLDGLAFGRGPGGFTGLRVAAGVVQGLAFGAKLRVAPVSSLAAVACQVGAAGEPVEPGMGADVLVCNDARMGEVYWACYRVPAGEPEVPVALAAERVSPPDSVVASQGVGHFAGNGFLRHPGLRTRLENAGLRFHDGLYPRADIIARLGAAMLSRGEGVAAADALPVYVRDDVARPSASAVTESS